MKLNYFQKVIKNSEYFTEIQFFKKFLNKMRFKNSNISRKNETS